MSDGEFGLAFAAVVLITICAVAIVYPIGMAIYMTLRQPKKQSAANNQGSGEE